MIVNNISDRMFNEPAQFFKFLQIETDVNPKTLLFHLNDLQIEQEFHNLHVIYSKVSGKSQITKKLGCQTTQISLYFLMINNRYYLY